MIEMMAVCVFCFRIDQRINNTVGGGATWEVVANISSQNPTPAEYIQKFNVSDRYNFIEYRVVCFWDDIGKPKIGLPSDPSAVIRPVDECFGKLLYNVLYELINFKSHILYFVQEYADIYQVIFRNSLSLPNNVFYIQKKQPTLF